MSCTIVLEQVADTFATSSVLILTVAWVHAVDIFAITWLDHLVIRVRDITERSINGIEWDSGLHELVVEVVSDRISGAWLWLVDLRVERCTKFSMLSQWLIGIAAFGIIVIISIIIA